MQQRDEDKLQAALWELIQLRKHPGVLAWAVVNNPRNVIDGARLKRLGMVRGVPDLHFLANGRYYTLEVKTKKGRMTDDQITWMTSLNAAGAIADIGHGWDECCHVLKLRNLIKPGVYGRFFGGAADEVVQTRSKRSPSRNDRPNG